jgi:hypothetical protein
MGENASTIILMKWYDHYTCITECLPFGLTIETYLLNKLKSKIKKP